MTPSPDEPVALIADLHGNLTALEAVLADIGRRGIERVVVLGDLAGKGPRPAEVVDRVRSLGCAVIRGNWDELLAQGGNAALDWHRARLGPERLAYLARLAYRLDLERDDGTVRLFHSSAESVWHRVYPWSGPSELAGMFEATGAIGPGAPTPQAVGYADIHTAFALHLRGHDLPEDRRHLRGRLLFNTGSVGNPLDRPVPSYAILEPGPGLGLTLARVPYDVEAECRVAVASGMPHLEEYLDETRTARYHPRA